MPTVSRILDEKKAQLRGDVVTVRPDESVLDAARRMNENHLGCVVVASEDAQIEGIFTERDILTRVVAAELSPSETPVRTVMTAPVLYCRRDTPTDEVRALMREKRVRHVPVIEEGRVVGMVSIGDLNTVDARTMQQTIEYLERYMYTA